MSSRESKFTYYNIDSANRSARGSPGYVGGNIYHEDQGSNKNRDLMRIFIFLRVLFNLI